MTAPKNSRTEKLAADQSIVDGIQKNQAKLPASFPMEGQTMTLAGVTQVFQDRVTSGKAVVTADNARTAAVKADRTKRTQTQGVATAFRRLLIALFAQEPDVLGDFAVTAPKKPQVSTAVKAGAAAKAKATRETLGTKGPVQKKAALAAAAVSTAPAAASPAPVVVPPPTPEPAQPAPAPVVAPAPKPAS